jgi:hypothetical protein
MVSPKMFVCRKACPVTASTYIDVLGSPGVSPQKYDLSSNPATTTAPKHNKARTTFADAVLPQPSERYVDFFDLSGRSPEVDLTESPPAPPVDVCHFRSARRSRPRI